VQVSVGDPSLIHTGLRRYFSNGPSTNSISLTIVSKVTALAPSAGFQDGDLLITEHHWGAFANTALEEQLRLRGIDTVALTGISTNAGVESTLRQGTGLGFAFIMAEDACSGQDGEEHRFTFEKIFPRLAQVRTANEIIKALA
jgi:nicotinamidase-related amidase